MRLKAPAATSGASPMEIACRRTAVSGLPVATGKAGLLEISQAGAMRPVLA